MKVLAAITVLLCSTLFRPIGCEAESERKPLRIGFVGSLTSFAGSYGTAVLEGAKLAAAESGAIPVEIYVEDDQSVAKNTVLAYQKLRSVNRIDALITGTWWANSIVKTVERDRIPFLSCETLYNEDFIESPNYFSLHGDLRDWVRVFEPLAQEKGWKTGAMVKFVSGFALTLKKEMEALFSKDGRRFLKALEYADIEMSEAATFAAQLKALAPDVVYVDSQPVSFATLISRLTEQKVGFTILSNSSAKDAFTQHLFDPAAFPGTIYFSARETFQPQFKEKFEKKYGHAPVLEADLGYYAVKLLVEAATKGGNPVDALKSGKLEVDGLRFTFDEHNVYRGLKQELFTFKNGKPVQVSTGPG